MKPPFEYHIKDLCNSLNNLFFYAKSSNALTDEIKVNYFQNPSKARGAKNCPTINPDEKDRLVNRLIWKNEFYHGMPVTHDNRFDRMFNLVTLCMLLYGPRLPFFTECKINKVKLNELVTFFECASQHSNLAEKVTMNFILPHVEWDGSKGYTTMLVAPSLLKEMTALITPVFEFWKSHPNLPCPPAFGSYFLDKNTCSKEIKNNGYKKFPRTAYYGWFANLLKGADISKQEELGPYYFKKLLLSLNSTHKNNDAILLEKMTITANTLKNIVKKHYMCDLSYGKLLNPLDLKVKWEDLIKFETQYKYYLKPLNIQNQETLKERRCHFLHNLEGVSLFKPLNVWSVPNRRRHCIFLYPDML